MKIMYYSNIDPIRSSLCYANFISVVLIVVIILGLSNFFDANVTTFGNCLLIRQNGVYVIQQQQPPFYGHYAGQPVLACTSS